MNVSSFLTDAAQVWPQVPACITSRGHTSFADLHSKAHALSQTLSNRGLLPGMGLGLMACNGPDFIIGLFAGLYAGAVVMPISHHLKEQELERITDVVPVAALLYDSSIEPPSVTDTAAKHIWGGFKLAIRGKDFQAPVACGVPGAAVVRFTSGTTGTSKGVVLSHQSVDERTALAVQGLGLKAGDKVTWVLPMAYHFVVSILAYVRSGVTIVLPDDESPESILACSANYNASLLYASPVVVQMLAADESNQLLPSGMRVVSTSSGLSPEVSTAFEIRFGRRVDQVYGLIEVGLPLGTLDQTSPPTGSVGRALPGYEVAVINETGNQLPVGTIGKLAVRGSGMFDAYLAPFRPLASVLVNGWFLTGDLALQSSDGSIVVCGREKSVISCGGNKVFPEEIERVMNSYPGVRTSRAFSASHPTLGEVVSAEVVTLSGWMLDIEGLRRYCMEKLSEYKAPKDIRLVEALPVTDSGKIVRTA